ncbi:MAG: hypothetical protein BroJett011_17140 [Chloroflexota bacterium]|nr:MAG: hypothetical protein BroJett011_17140 [Chloroflexota bacterium]
MKLQSLYTFGYSGKQPDELLALVEQLDAVVADIRFSPRSRIPQWNGGRLAQLLGDRYHHLPALGNRNYKDGPVEIVDLEAGLPQVADLLVHQPVILLCVCADIQHCHRRLAAEAIVARYGASLTHL